jgi:hypothetical protein
MQMLENQLSVNSTDRHDESIVNLIQKDNENTIVPVSAEGHGDDSHRVINIMSVRSDDEQKVQPRTIGVKASRSNKEEIAEDSDIDIEEVMQSYSENPDEIQPIAQMAKHRNKFNDLLETKHVDTANPIVSMIISYDSTRALSITTKSNSEFLIKIFSLDTNELLFIETLGGESKDYIKCKDIEQSPSGGRFVVCYNNDG